MNDFRSTGDLLLTTVFTIFWLLSRPFVWAYTFSKWFVVSVAKETGNKMVKIVGGTLAVGIIAYITQIFSH